MKKKKILRITATFLILMLAFTILSRAAYQEGTAVVHTARPENKMITHTVTADGKAEQIREVAVVTEPDQRITQVYVYEGQTAAKGDPLFSIDLALLEEKITYQQQEMEKQRLQTQDALSGESANAARRGNELAAAVENRDLAISRAGSQLSAASRDLKKAKKALKEFRAQQKAAKRAKAQSAAENKGELLERDLEEKQAAYLKAQQELVTLEWQIEHAVDEALRRAAGIYADVAAGSDPDESVEAGQDPGKSPEAVPDPGKSPEAGQDPGESLAAGQDPGKSLEAGLEMEEISLTGVSLETADLFIDEDEESAIPGDANLPFRGTALAEPQRETGTFQGSDLATSGGETGNLQEIDLATPSGERGIFRDTESTIPQEEMGIAQRIDLAAQQEEMGSVWEEEDRDGLIQEMPGGEMMSDIPNTAIIDGLISDETATPLAIKDSVGTDFPISQRPTRAALEETERKVRLSYQGRLTAAREKEETAKAELESVKEAMSAYQQELASSGDNSGQNEAQLLAEVTAASDAYTSAALSAHEAAVTGGRSVASASLPEGSNSTARIDEILCEQMQLALDKLERLREKEGVVQAPVDGQIMKVSVTTGEKTADSTAILMADSAGGYRFSAVIGKEAAQFVGTGDPVTLTSGKLKYEELPVTAVTADVQQPEQYLVTVDLPEEFEQAGMAFHMELSKKSAAYPVCVPLSALHLDSNNLPYVLVPEAYNSIMGTEFRARKIGVSILEKNESYAALEEGALGAQQEIIISADRAVDEGSRIRIG